MRGDTQTADGRGGQARALAQWHGRWAVKLAGVLLSDDPFITSERGPEVEIPIRSRPMSIGSIDL